MKIIAVDDERIALDGLLDVIRQVAPEAELNDGILDVMIVNEISLLKIAKVLPMYQAGKHFKEGHIIPELKDIIEYYPAKHVKIHPIDTSQDMIVNVDVSFFGHPTLNGLRVETCYVITENGAEPLCPEFEKELFDYVEKH